MISIRIANPPESLFKEYPEGLRSFFFNYSKKVYQFFTNDVVQEFLDELIENEEIDKDKIKDIRIMVFPSSRKVGDRQRAGYYNEIRRQISVHPFIFNSEKDIPDWIKKSVVMKESEPALIFMIIVDQMKTMIHEILHLKYDSGYRKKHDLTKNQVEEIVDDSSKEYFSKFLESFGFSVDIIRIFFPDFQ